MEATMQLEKKTEQEKEKKKAQRKKLVGKLKEIFREHVGIEQGISHIELLKEVYGEKVNEFTKYQKYYLFGSRITPALRWLRAHTKFFVIASKHGEKSTFFIIKNIEEFSAFKYKSLKNIDGINRSVDRCERAVNEEWYNNLDEVE